MDFSFVHLVCPANGNRGEKTVSPTESEPRKEPVPDLQSRGKKMGFFVKFNNYKWDPRSN